MTTLELGRVTDRRPPFKYSALARVWFSDTDAQGVVYYGRYLPYFDHARVEYHRHVGPLDVGAPRVRDARVHRRVPRARPLRRPARGLRAHGEHRRHERDLRVRRVCASDDDALMVTASQTLVLVDLAERHAARIPDAVRALMQSFEGADLSA